MDRVRIFQSALNNVKYAAGKPLTVSEFLALPLKEKQKLWEKVRG